MGKLTSIKLLILIALFHTVSPTYAIDFDIWNTGISRHEMTSLAQKHNLPLAIDGKYHVSKSFNPSLVAGDGNRFYYKTLLLEHPAKVTLSLSPRKGGYGQFLYEIEVLFTDIRKNRDLKPYLLELLQKKYGNGLPGTNLIQSFRIWHPADDEEVRLISGPASLQIKYTDLKIKAIAEKISKSTFNLHTPQKHEDAGKF
jgi:hypothetical protein